MIVSQARVFFTDSPLALWGITFLVKVFQWRSGKSSMTLCRSSSSYYRGEWFQIFLIMLLSVLLFLSSSCALKEFSYASIDLGPVESWTSPVNQEVVLTQKFKPPHNRKHKGIDLAGHLKQPIYAVNNGLVVFQGHSRGYGQVVIIQHLEDWSTLYAHLFKIHVEDNEYVQIGQRIGLMGQSGRATGVHLHFEVHKGGFSINPLNIIPKEHIVGFQP